MKSFLPFAICLLVVVAIIFVSLPSADAQWGKCDRKYLLWKFNSNPSIQLNCRCLP